MKFNFLNYYNNVFLLIISWHMYFILLDMYKHLFIAFLFFSFISIFGMSVSAYSYSEGFHGHAYVIGPKIKAVSDQMSLKLNILDVSKATRFFENSEDDKVMIEVIDSNEDISESVPESLNSLASFEAVSRRFN